MTSPAMQQTLDALKIGRREHDRDMLRRAATKYQRKAKDLYHWTFPPTRLAIFRAVHRPYEHAATKALCKAIYADLQTARAMPKFYQRRNARIAVLRELFACECAAYRRERRAAMMLAANPLRIKENV